MAIATPSRLSHVQALRGFAALLVLLSHLVQIEGRTAARPILPDNLEWGMMGVDLFFVISGFIMIYVTRDWEDGGARKVPEFLFARATRIYPLYWIISAALFVVWQVQPDLVFSSSPNEPQLLNSVFLIPAYAFPLLEVGWTLVYEMMFYFLFAALLFLPARWRGLGLILWAATVLLGNALGWQSASALTFHLFSPLVLEFIAGCGIGWIYLRWTAGKRIAIILTVLSLLGLLHWFTSALPFEDQWPRVLRLTIPAAGLVLGAAWLDRHNVSIPRIAITLGDWSYSLYLTHLLTLVTIAQLWNFAGLNGLPAILLIIVLITSSLIVAGLTYHWIEKPLVDASRMLRGRLFT